MRSILDHFVHRNQAFRPKIIDDVLALRVAQKLGDEAAAAHYSALVAEHSSERVLAAYRRVIKSGQKSDLAHQFHTELQQGNGRTAFNDDVRLIAIKVERRSVAAAVFIGMHLEFTDIRHLSSQARRAQASAIGFTHQITSGFNVESAALESVSTGKDIRRAVLSAAIIDACIQSHGISLWQPAKKQLFESFGHPALRSRKELREVILSMWPVLQDSPRVDQALDAVALGALVQIERLFLY